MNCLTIVRRTVSLQIPGGKAVWGKGSGKHSRDVMAIARDPQRGDGGEESTGESEAE